MNELFITCFCLILMLPTVIVVYQMVPKIFYRLDKQNYANTKSHRFSETLAAGFERIPFPKKSKERLIIKIEESGIGDSSTWIYWIIVTIALPILLFVLLSYRRNAIGNTLALCILCFVLPNIFLQGQIEKRKRAFIVNAYKLYYFLHSQISSGIKTTDAIRGLHEIADHPMIQKVFVKFVAQYELTLNIEESLQVLRKSFSGYDCEMLCVSIQQCVSTGMAGKTLLKMEQMMFSKYFFYLQKDTEKFKSKLLISGLFAIVPLVMVFLFPMLFDATKAFETILEING